jgi:hypothetical protein
MGQEQVGDSDLILMFSAYINMGSGYYGLKQYELSK